MKLSDFDYQLPEALIAQEPLAQRDEARLMVIDRRRKTIDHDTFSHLGRYLDPRSVLVTNNSKVIPARLFGKRRDARVELLLHRQVGNYWTAFAKPAKRLNVGDSIAIGDDFFASVLKKGEGGEVTLAFNCSGADFYAQLERHGHMPLPPYIKREDTAGDRTTYQTVYAKHEGSVAAPTAGLHFTPEILQALEARGVQTAFVTLHVGAGTFQPVKVDDTDDHKMHHEYATITAESADRINRAKSAGGKVIAVGTTSLRILETVASNASELKEFSGETNIFITSGYRFKSVDRLITNFHLPRSTLFMLVSAFAGTDRMKQAYAHAIDTGYRFYSYGDACLLEPNIDP